MKAQEAYEVAKKARTAFIEETCREELDSIFASVKEAAARGEESIACNAEGAILRHLQDTYNYRVSYHGERLGKAAEQEPARISWDF